MKQDQDHQMVAATVQRLLTTLSRIEKDFNLIQDEIGGIKKIFDRKLDEVYSRIGKWGDLIYKLREELYTVLGDQIPEGAKDPNMKETRRERPVKPGEK